MDSRTYSVPSRLIGVMVGVRLYPDHVEVYYKGHLVESGSGSCAGSSGCPPWRLRQSAASAMPDTLMPFRRLWRYWNGRPRTDGYARGQTRP